MAFSKPTCKDFDTCKGDQKRTPEGSIMNKCACCPIAKKKIKNNK